MATKLQDALVRKQELHANRSFLRIRQVMAQTGKSRSAIYADIQAGNFPAPVHLSAGPSARAVAWDSRAIDAWMEERISASRAAA